MKPSALTYHRPESIAAVCDVLARLGHEAKVLAGGQSLIPMLSMRLAAPANLIDINMLPEQDGISIDRHGVTFRALVRHSALLADDDAHQAQPLLRRALQLVAHPTIRNRGTTVGSIVHSDPAAEMPAVLGLLGGTVRAQSQRGIREIAATDFFLGPLECGLAEDEIAVAVTVPRRAPNEGSAIDEIARRHGDYAVAGVAAQVRIVDGVLSTATACYVSAGELGTPMDFTEVLRGVDPADADDSRWNAAGDLARDTIETETDIHASSSYRSQLVAALTARVLHEAARDALRNAAARTQRPDGDAEPRADSGAEPREDSDTEPREDSDTEPRPDSGAVSQSADDSASASNATGRSGTTGGTR
ncbi:FAD binding domain-containing protein [Saxibacter everestensis]|uniref:FAD binding domain-containing protein n=1 Tax=Saxibacter everestensis TaxID=2909229 RepID=A0ABY8QVJ5_9MICO|nr:FAD binding domain-containing protein [Brevibacteriaceae bacterium ZFBP1038]